jgi:hypothetical protein
MAARREFDFCCCLFLFVSACSFVGLPTITFMQCKPVFRMGLFIASHACVVLVTLSERQSDLDAVAAPVLF